MGKGEADKGNSNLTVGVRGAAKCVVGGVVGGVVEAGSGGGAVGSEVDEVSVKGVSTEGPCPRGNWFGWRGGMRHMNVIG